MTFKARVKASKAVEATERSNEAQVIIETGLEDAVVEGLLAGWTFFAPKHKLTRELLLLNDELGGAYFEEEYKNLAADDEPEPIWEDGGNILSRVLEKLTGSRAEEQEPVQDRNWFRWLYLQASETLFHGDAGAAHRRKQSEDEAVEFFRTYVSESVFNHLAMLSRSRHARRGGCFSIRNELTREVAEKVGLGLYLHEKTAPELRTRGDELLLKLAGDFQNWLVDEQHGVFVTTWGGIHVPDKQIVDLHEGHTLALTPDV